MGKKSNFLSLILFQLFIQARFQELIRRDPSLLQKKFIVNMDPNQKSKSVTYLVVHTIFFYNYESKSIRYRQQKNLSKCNMLNYRCETFIGIKSTTVYRFWYNISNIGTKAKWKYRNLYRICFIIMIRYRYQNDIVDIINIQNKEKSVDINSLTIRIRYRYDIVNIDRKAKLVLKQWFNDKRQDYGLSLK